MLAAVKNKGLIFKYASRRIRGIKEIALEAIKNDIRAKSYVDEFLKDDEEIKNFGKTE